MSALTHEQRVDRFFQVGASLCGGIAGGALGIILCGVANLEPGSGAAQLLMLCSFLMGFSITFAGWHWASAGDRR